MSFADAPAGVRAFVFATVRAGADLPVPPDFPAALLPLGHATLIERVIEQLVRSGIKDIDVVACDRPESLRRALGDGGRWGIALRWHLAKDPVRPYAALRSAGIEPAQRLLVGHADRWLAPQAFRRLAAEPGFAVHVNGADAPVWTGWAGVDGRALAALRADGDEQALADDLARVAARTIVLSHDEGYAPLDAASLMRAQASVLRGSDDAPLPKTWIPTPWGALSPGARVHPGAIIEGPALIGPGCLVAEGATVGPNAVLSRDVVVDSTTHVRDALVLPGTYLGRGLDVHQAIVNGGRIRHVALGVETVLPAADGLVLSLSAKRVARPSVAGRVVAAATAALAAPLVAAGALARRRGEPLLPWTTQTAVVGFDDERKTVTRPVRCPRPKAGALRRAAGSCGGLLDIAQGRRCWFGVRPRRSGEWYALSAEWQNLLASAPIGLLNAPAWSDDASTHTEALAAADAYYAVRRGWKENLRVALAALRPARPQRTGGAMVSETRE